MKTLTPQRVSLCLFLLALSASAKIIVVNTTNNVSPGAGQTNLVQAINLLADGDTIRFNIPGNGPQYIVTPVGGYPVMSNNDLLIDGYSQPGSAPNSNTFLAANNAALKIVLDSRNGEGTSNAGPGFGADETGVLFFMGTNCHVRGLCFLGIGNSAGNNNRSAVNIGYSASGTHVSGCWIGVDVDGTTLATFDRGVTAFGDSANGWPIGTVVGVQAGPADTAGARAQQNVIVGSWVNVFLESKDMIVAGNKLNVLPSGMQDVDQHVAPLEAVIETGRVNNNMRVGTDGDGNNDAEERNVFGGVTSAGDNNIIEIYSQDGTYGACTNIVIAGNYIGVAVDGVTTFTNSMLIVDHFTRTVSGVRSSCQFGSDFDGVSDDIEANVIYMNKPFDLLFPIPPGTSPPKFCNMTAEGSVSLRGNKLVNNALAPFTYADGSYSQLTPFTNYCAPYMEITNGIIPSLDATNSSITRLKGKFAVGVAPFTNVMIDLYQLDLEGWYDGKLFQMVELTDNITYSNGFPQGAKFLRSFTVPNTGVLDIDISGLDLGAGFLTVTANYSADPPGTHHGLTHTSDFSLPIIFPRVKVALAGADVLLTWPGDAGTFTVQSTSTLSPPAWSSLSPQPPIVPVGTNYQATVPFSPPRNFYRLVR